MGVPALQAMKPALRLNLFEQREAFLGMSLRGGESVIFCDFIFPDLKD